MKTALGIIQLWSIYFTASFFNTLGKKFPKSIAGHTKCSCGPCVWDPWSKWIYF